MSKKWLILGSVSFSVGLSLSLIINKDVKQAALTGLLSVPATAAGVSVVEHQRRQKLNDKISTQEKQLQSLVQQEAEFNNLIASLSDRKSNLKLEITSLEAKLQQLKEKEIALLSSLESLSSNKQILATDLENNRHTLQRLQKQKSNLEEELNNLTQQKQRLNNELDSQHDLLTQLQQKQADLANAIADLNTNKQELEVQFVKQQHLKAEIESLQQDKLLAESSLADLENKKKQIAANCVELETRNNLIQHEFDNRIVQKNNLDTEIDRLKNEEIELGQSLTRLEQEKSNIKSQHNTFKVELNNLREHKEDLAIQVQQLNSLLVSSKEEFKEDREELNTKEIVVSEIIDIKENINDRNLNLSNVEDTKYLWQNVILPDWNHRDRPAGYRFLGNVNLDCEQSDRIIDLVGDELQRRGGISNDLESNLLKIITFVLSEYAYYSEEDKFWQGFCDRIGIEHSPGVENTFREITEQGINLLGLICASGGYKYVSTLWLQSGVPKQNMGHFATILQDVADEYGWWELSHSSVEDIAETLWQCWQNRYSQWGTIRHFLALDNSNEDLEPISGQLVKNIATVARELEYRDLDPETINDREAREDLISDSNLSYSFFLRDWSDLITVLNPRNNNFSRIVIGRNRSPYLYLDVVDTLNTLLILPEQSLWENKWQNLRGSYCLIPDADWENTIPLQGNLEIPELEIDIKQAANIWSYQLQNHHRNEIHSWKHQGINPDFPCLIFDAISGEHIQISISEAKIIGIEEIIVFTHKEVEIELDDNIEIIDALVPSSIKAWQGKEIRLIESESLIRIQDVVLTWQRKAKQEPQLIGLRIKGKKIIYINAPTFYYPPQEQQITLNYQIESIDSKSIITKDYFYTYSDNTWNSLNLEQWITDAGNYQATFWHKEKQWSYRFEVRQEYRIDRYQGYPSLEIRDRNNNILSIPAKYNDIDEFWSEEIKLDNLYPLEELSFNLKGDCEQYQFQIQADGLGKITLSLATLYHCLSKCDRYTLDINKSNLEFIRILQIGYFVSWEIRAEQIIFTELPSTDNYYLSGWNLLNPNKEIERISFSSPDSEQIIVDLGFSPGIYLIQLYQDRQLIENLGLWCGIDPHNIPEEINNNETLANYCYAILGNETLADFSAALEQLNVNFDRDKIQIILDSLYRDNYFLPEWLETDSLTEKIQRILESLLQPVTLESSNITVQDKKTKEIAQANTISGQWCLVTVRQYKRELFIRYLNNDIEQKQLQQLILEIIEPRESVYSNMILLRISSFAETKRLLQPIEYFQNVGRLNIDQVNQMLNR